MDIVLGAGIVGVCTALHLQSRGRDVIIVDREGPASGTSFGNAGLIERSDLLPRAFPRRVGEMAHYLFTGDLRVKFDWGYMPRLAPWLMKYRRYSAPKSLARIANELEPLFLHSIDEHKSLLQDANARHLWRSDGWISLYRSGPLSKEVKQGVMRAQDAGMRADILDTDEIRMREPALQRDFAAGIHWRDSASVSDPAALVEQLAATFKLRGGAVRLGDAKTLKRKGNTWQVTAHDGEVLSASNAVVALGPWSGDLIKRFGYRYPLAVKRGYHMHYQLDAEATPRLPVIDMEMGYVLNPMAKGVRLTTGIEFAHREASPDPKQLQRSEKPARELVPLGSRLDAKPWMGSRPCTADMKPVIGPAPRHKGLWFAFGHAHHGLTLGPITGRLLAEQMCGEIPFVPAKPFLPSRFRLLAR